VVAMVKRALKVKKLTPEADAEWRAVIDKLRGDIRGKIVPADLFDEAQRSSKEFRSATDGRPK
jgi:hypothetical protein